MHPLNRNALQAVGGGVTILGADDVVITKKKVYIEVGFRNKTPVCCG